MSEGAGGLWFQDVEARGGEEVSYPRNGAYERCESAWFEMELHFVVGIDEIEASVHHLQLLLLDEVLKGLDGAFGALDVHKFLDYAVVFVPHVEYGAVDGTWQDVVEGQMAEKFVVADLLVSAKWHLPCGERHEDHASGLDVFLEV